MRQRFRFTAFWEDQRVEVSEAAYQSLLHYHYNNKITLYEAVFERRARVIQVARLKKLKEVISRNGSLEDILHILFLPLEKLLNEKRGKLRYYVQMLSSITISSDELSVKIVKKFYDPSAEDFIAAFKSVDTALTHDQAVWAYLFAIGARMQAHSPSGRAERLGATKDEGKPYDMLVNFVTGGIRAIHSAA